PIPINASTGMLLSLAVALVFTPWASLKLLRRHAAEGGSGAAAKGNSLFDPARMERLSRAAIGPFLGTDRKARRHRRRLYGGVAAAILAAVSLLGFTWV